MIHRLVSRIDRFNEWVAVKGTTVFGNMWTYWAFVIYGALGAVFTAAQAVLLYWSNWIQLWSLPLLMVGQIVTGRGITVLIKETHDAVMEELTLAQASRESTTELIQDMRELIDDLHTKHDVLHQAVSEIQQPAAEPGAVTVRTGADER